MNHKSCWKIKKENMRYYNKTSNIYDAQYREEQVRKYKVALEALSLPEYSCILDVGCGTGLFVEEVAGLGGCAVCVDCSKKMIKRAKRVHGGQQIFLCADADYLPFIGRAFDNIFSFTLIQNMPDPQRTMLEMCRVAKIGSRIVLSAPKKAFTSSSFTHLLDGEGLAIVRFVDEEELKDYLAICRSDG